MISSWLTTFSRVCASSSPLPPTPSSYYTIAIGCSTAAVLLVIGACDLEGESIPAVDFLVVFGAGVLFAVGGLF